MNILNLKKILNIFFILFLFTNFLIAETVILNDGTAYKGNIHHQDDKIIYIVQGEDLIKINRQDVKEIKKDEKPNKDIIETLDLDENIIENKNEFIIKLGYDWNGDYESNKDKISAPNGINASAEFHHYIKNIIGVGLGIGGCNPRDAKFCKGDFYILPTYLSLKLRSQPTYPYKYGYIFGQLGYNFLIPNDTLKKSIDMEDGLYYGVGFGIVISHILFELMYSFNNGKVGKEDKMDLKYSKYTFSIGYVF